MRRGRVKDADAYTCDRVVPALGIVALASCYGRGHTLSERGFHMSPPTALDSASPVACAAYRRLLIVAAAVASLLVLGVGATAAAMQDDDLVLRKQSHDMRTDEVRAADDDDAHLRGAHAEFFRHVGDRCNRPVEMLAGQVEPQVLGEAVPAWGLAHHGAAQLGVVRPGAPVDVG